MDSIGSIIDARLSNKKASTLPSGGKIDALPLLKLPAFGAGVKNMDH
jgi:hypothetical protein